LVRILAIVAGTIATLYLLIIPLLERVVPRRVLVAYWRISNPIWSKSSGLFPGFGIVETTGRKTGRKHQVPVGGRLKGNQFWFVAANSRESHYVKNIEADPQVRLKVRGRWRQGTATLLPDDKIGRRLLRINPLNSIFIRIAGRNLLTVRVDLEPD
jgi:deazaflavin-dependent oxidoreductase (nitroreductase family)